MEGEECHSMWLIATVDVEDPDEALDLVIERVVAMQVEEGIRLHLLPERPAERVLADFQQSMTARSLAKDTID